MKKFLLFASVVVLGMVYACQKESAPAGDWSSLDQAVSDRGDSLHHDSTCHHHHGDSLGHPQFPHDSIWHPHDSLGHHHLDSLGHPHLDSIPHPPHDSVPGGGGHPGGPKGGGPKGGGPKGGGPKGGH